MRTAQSADAEVSEILEAYKTQIKISNNQLKTHEDGGIRLMRKYLAYKGEKEAQARKRAIAEGRG